MLIVLAVGCSRGTSDYVSVTGTVTIDGKPADGVRVDFLPANESDSSVRDRYASGYTDKAGRFEVRSVSGQGIPPGEYKVTFSRMLAHGKGVDPKKKTSNTRESLPDKYLTKEKTDQTAQVTKDKTDFVFDLSSRLK
ncbi:MAG TPA: hypothetical protein VGJ05_16490 [Fimbriiglobus sp.]